MDIFNFLKKFMWLALAIFPLLVSCSILLDNNDVVDERHSLGIIGFASDTTAILLKHYWVVVESPCGWFGTCDETDHLDVELQLVDVRFQNIYWKSRVKNVEGIMQLKDSAMLIRNSEGYWLWAIGKSKLQKVNFNWNVDKENYEDYLFRDDFRIRRWKNDSLLLFSNELYYRGHAIIDTKTMTINRWAPLGEYAWTLNCDDFWWSDVEDGLCLVKNENSCGFSLLSKDGYTLGRFTHPDGCENYKGFSVARNFIAVSEIKNNYNPATTAMFLYDERGNIAHKPSFWIGVGGFVDSLGNVTEY